MKKIVRTIATVALMFVVATSTAKEPTLTVTPNAEKSLTFAMDATSEQTMISIVDLEGAVIYSNKVIAEAAYSKKFNLSNLPDGSYVLKVEGTLKVTTFEFDIYNSKVLIEERKENVKPVFRNIGEKVYLNFLNLEKEEVKVIVYDSNGRAVFKETIADTMLIEKAFNFEKAFADTYTVVVKNGKDTFYENVFIK